MWCSRAVFVRQDAWVDVAWPACREDFVSAPETLTAEPHRWSTANEPRTPSGALPTGGAMCSGAMAVGRSKHSIAKRLFDSPKTVEACTGRSFARLGLGQTPDDHRRAVAVVTSVRQPGR